MLPLPPGKERITIRVDTDILEYFRDAVDRAGAAIIRPRPTRLCASASRPKRNLPLRRPCGASSGKSCALHPERDPECSVFDPPPVQTVAARPFCRLRPGPVFSFFPAPNPLRRGSSMRIRDEEPRFYPLAIVLIEPRASSWGTLKMKWVHQNSRSKETITTKCDPSTTFRTGFAGSTMRLTARARMWRFSIPTWPKRSAIQRRSIKPCACSCSLPGQTFQEAFKPTRRHSRQAALRAAPRSPSASAPRAVEWPQSWACDPGLRTSDSLLRHSPLPFRPRTVSAAPGIPRSPMPLLEIANPPRTRFDV